MEGCYLGQTLWIPSPQFCTSANLDCNSSSWAMNNYQFHRYNQILIYPCLCIMCGWLVVKLYRNNLLSQEHNMPNPGVQSYFYFHSLYNTKQFQIQKYQGIYQCLWTFLGEFSLKYMKNVPFWENRSNQIHCKIWLKSPSSLL